MAACTVFTRSVRTRQLADFGRAGAPTGRAALRALAAAVAVAATLTGCGFVGAAGVSNRKPDDFVLRGHVSVPVAPGGDRPVGSACESSDPGVVVNAPLRVIDPQGRQIATGYLGDGQLGRDASGTTCDFPFEIPAVPGGLASYGLSVGTRPAQVFSGQDLRENQQAVLSVAASATPNP